MTSDDRMLALERIELEAWRDLYESVPARVAASSGLTVRTYGPVIAAHASSEEVAVFNRVLGVGIVEPARRELLEEIVEGYRAAGAGRFYLPLAPCAMPEGIEGWLAEHAMTPYVNRVKLWRSTSSPPATPRTELRVEQVGPAGGRVAGRIFAEAFGWPESAMEWIASAVGRDRWMHYVVYDEHEPIATAALYASGTSGWLGLAATVPSHQGRGAQSALIARRIEDAARMGVELLAVETAEDLPATPSPSNRNLRRLGFEEAYVRPNYAWIAPESVDPHERTSAR